MRRRRVKSRTIKTRKEEYQKKKDSTINNKTQTRGILEEEEFNQEQKKLDKNNIRISNIKPRTTKPRQQQYQKKN